MNSSVVINNSVRMPWSPSASTPKIMGSPESPAGVGYESALPTKVKVRIAITSSAALRNFTHMVVASIEAVKNARPMEPLKIFLLTAIPISIGNIITTLRSLGGTSNNEKADAGLFVASEIGTIADVVATSTSGFMSIGLLSARVAIWATPLFFVGVGLETAGIILTIKNMVETHVFSKKLDKAAGVAKKVEEYSIEHFARGVEEIETASKKEKSFVTKHFSVDNDKLLARLNKVKKKATEAFASMDEGRIERSRHKMKTTMDCLSKRLTSQNWSRALTILAFAVGIIGVGVLFVCPPAGFALIGTAAVISLANFLDQRRQTAAFEKEMKLLNVEVAE